MVVEKEMVAMINFAEVEREIMVVTYGVVHRKEDMIASEQDRNDMNGLALFILVSKFERIVHDENYSRGTNVESDYYFIIIIMIGIWRCIITIKMWFRSHTCTYLWLVSSCSHGM